MDDAPIASSWTSPNDSIDLFFISKMGNIISKRGNSTSESTARPISTNPERPIVGPLTTFFTPSSDCSYYFFQGLLGPLMADRCTQSTTGRVCLPQNPQSLQPFQYFYSPSLMCPSGYTSACGMIGSDKRIAAISTASGYLLTYFPSIQWHSNETIVGCCPSGFTCSSSPGCYVEATSTVFSRCQLFSRLACTYRIDSRA